MAWRSGPNPKGTASRSDTCFALGALDRSTRRRWGVKSSLRPTNSPVDETSKVLDYISTNLHVRALFQFTKKGVDDTGH